MHFINKIGVYDYIWGTIIFSKFDDFTKTTLVITFPGFYDLQILPAFKILYAYQ